MPGFFHLSIALVDGKQNLSEVVFNALVGFSLQETRGDDLVSGSYPYIQDMLDSKNSDLDFMNTIITGDEPWVYGNDPGTYNENSLRALNTT